MKDGCPFCDYSGPSPILWQRGSTSIIVPINPVTQGHVLAVPRRHVEDAVVEPGVTAAVMLAACEYARRFGVGPCNFITSVGVEATQSIRHLHIHVVPRREGDWLALPWSEARCGFIGILQPSGPHEPCSELATEHRMAVAGPRGAYASLRFCAEHALVFDEGRRGSS